MELLKRVNVFSKQVPHTENVKLVKCKDRLTGHNFE
jgi:hypothetical protein